MYRFCMILFIVLLAGCQIPSQETNNISTEKRGNILNKRFIKAAEAGKTEEVLAILADGADINATDEQGRTAIMAATYHNRVDTVKALMNEGADINIRDHQLNNVLLYAGAEGFLEIVKLAIEAGADTTLTNRYGGTALIPASERGHVKVVETLLEQSDIDVDHINKLHWTALLEAVILGNGKAKHQQIVQLLVDHGANIDIGDEDGVTPIQHAQSRGFKEIERILKKADT